VTAESGRGAALGLLQRWAIKRKKSEANLAKKRSVLGKDTVETRGGLSSVRGANQRLRKPEMKRGKSPRWEGGKKEAR